MRAPMRMEISARMRGRGFGIPGLGMIVAAFCAVAALIGTVSCQRDAGSAGSASRERVATIRVEAGNGRLAGGEEYIIAEWRSGAQPSGAGYYADFRGQDGGPTLDLSLSGLKGTGTFACGKLSAAASLELRVDVNNAYRATPDAPCQVEVESIENGVLQGRYTATLRHTGNPRDEMTVSGIFRATRPGSEIKAAKGPKLGMR
jgi:hypothetical protein